LESLSASAQNFTLWQQAKIEIMCHNNSIFFLFEPLTYGCYSSCVSHS